MKNALPRLKWLLRLSGSASLLAGLGAVLAVVWHRLLTPQLLESTLPGQPRLYRWRHGHIFYTLAGPEQGPPLVLWHAPGLAASAYELRELAAFLAEHYRVYAPDLLGFGLSDRPALSYSGPLYVELLSDFLREVVGQPALLIAQGTSCQYALDVARREPELCRALVLLRPEHDAGCWRERFPWLRSLLAFLARTPLLGLLTYCLLTTRLALRALSTPGQRQSDLDYSYATTHQFGAEHAVRAWLADRLRLEENGARPPANSLACPVLLVQADSERSKTHSWPGLQGQEAAVEQLWIETRDCTVDRQVAALISARLSSWPALAAQAEEASTAASGSGEAQEAPQAIESESAQSTATSAVAQTQHQLAAKSEPALEAYCVRCRQKSPMLAVSETTLKNGRPALQGTCARCGARMYRIVRR
ncbi:MAG: alpha/beta fold hydrolase [Thermogemmatispora sp.]|uniref:alpha/beta fold hydrolase n=1 Tax=Thermogemmatispora sp. TaxID=1968838 RepID=UPI0026051AE6|nr:alpha/beta fold hydrolase [Thermogemmatispora sp.]MBX5457999.1 alpha/beta fold hydrolase [Thermogemmatispora sp.]